METPSPVKRKAATIDLTRSDSEGEAPKRRRRVIEIESDDDDEEAPSPTTMPWETPEWQAHCAKKRESPVMGLLKNLFAKSDALGYGTSTDIHGSDEEMWRKIHDPVGHQRMWLTRILKDKNPPEGYIEEQVAEFARKLDGPCECLREGPRKCVSRRARHDCSCRLGDPGDCKATSHHACCCRHVESSYKRKDCKATTHECICPHVDRYERKDCKAQSHSCICPHVDRYDRRECKAASHSCICPHVDKYEMGDCKASTHKCACRGLDKYDMDRCRGSKHLCVCRKLDKYDFDRCKATKHLCTCRQLDKYNRDRCRAVKHLL